jgi:hypothetical protein
MNTLVIADTFHINPQLHLILSEMEEVIVSLNQHSIMEPKVKQINKKSNTNLSNNGIRIDTIAGEITYY